MSIFFDLASIQHIQLSVCTSLKEVSMPIHIKLEQCFTEIETTHSNLENPCVLPIKRQELFFMNLAQCLNMDLQAVI